MFNQEKRLQVFAPFINQGLLVLVRNGNGDWTFIVREHTDLHGPDLFVFEALGHWFDRISISPHRIIETRTNFKFNSGFVTLTFSESRFTGTLRPGKDHEVMIVSRRDFTPSMIAGDLQPLAWIPEFQNLIAPEPQAVTMTGFQGRLSV